MEAATDMAYSTINEGPATDIASSTNGEDAHNDIAYSANNGAPATNTTNGEDAHNDIAYSTNSEGPVNNMACSTNGKDPEVDAFHSINDEGPTTNIAISLNKEDTHNDIARSTNGEGPATNMACSINGRDPEVDAFHSINGEGPAADIACSLNDRDHDIDTTSSINGEGPNYWWRTSGSDLSRMLQEANYPEEAQRQFLNYYRDTICPLLGNKPESNSIHTAVGWDGNPFEYSFEFKGSTKNPGVRFVLDLSELRPSNKDHPLSISNSEKVLDTLTKRSPMFDATWHRALARWFVYSHVSPTKQQTLVAQVGYQTPTILGFDINARILDLAPDMLPVMAKSYFPPCFVAADRGFGRFQALSLGVRQMPDIGSYPNILLALKMIEDYVEDNPQYENCGRGMATDFVKAGKARLKVYMRYWGNSFDEIWDYYTLGGRIPDLEDDKEKLRDLIDLASGCDYPADKRKEENPSEQRRRAIFGQKPTSMYFSLSPEKPYPIPKMYFYPAFRAPNDQAIAQGLDAWMRKYGWYEGGKSLEEQIENVFTYRRLDEKPGIFTFIGIGRKEDNSKGGLSLQVYVTPELYETPRF